MGLCADINLETHLRSTMFMSFRQRPAPGNYGKIFKTGKGTSSALEPALSDSESNEEEPKGANKAEGKTTALQRLSPTA